jgi:hypothetical protein
VGVKTCTNDDKLGNAFGVANTLIVMLGVIGCIVALKCPIANEICLCDGLTESFSMDFNVTWCGWCDQPC